MAALNTLPIENSPLAFAILTCGVSTGDDVMAINFKLMPDWFPVCRNTAKIRNQKSQI
jgi:hypothetical protein